MSVARRGCPACWRAVGMLRSCSSLGSSFRLGLAGARGPGGWLAEPVRVSDRAFAVASAGDEDALIVDVQAVVGRVGIGHHVPRVALRVQEVPDDLVEPEPLRTGQ